MGRLTEQDAAEWDKLENGDEGVAVVKEDAPQVVATQNDASAPESQAASTPADDPFANLDPRVKDFITGIQTENKGALSRLSKVEGHIGSLKSELNATKAKLTAQGTATPTTGQITAAQKDPAKYEKLREDYPEFAEALDAKFEQKLQGLGSGPSKDEINSLVEQRAAEIAGPMVSRMRDELTIELRHQGWQDTTVRPEFVGWVQRQQPEVQTLYVSDKPRDVIRLLDLYAAESGVQQRTQQRLESAAALGSVGGRAGVAAKSFDQMTAAEQWAFMDAQEVKQK